MIIKDKKFDRRLRDQILKRDKFKLTFGDLINIDFSVYDEFKFNKNIVTFGLPATCVTTNTNRYNAFFVSKFFDGLISVCNNTESWKLSVDDFVDKNIRRYENVTLACKSDINPDVCFIAYRNEKVNGIPTKVEFPVAFQVVKHIFPIDYVTQMNFVVPTNLFAIFDQFGSYGLRIYAPLTYAEFKRDSGLIRYQYKVNGVSFSINDSAFNYTNCRNLSVQGVNIEEWVRQNGCHLFSIAREMLELDVSPYDLFDDSNRSAVKELMYAYVTLLVYEYARNLSVNTETYAPSKFFTNVLKPDEYKTPGTYLVKNMFSANDVHFIWLYNSTDRVDIFDPTGTFKGINLLSTKDVKVEYRQLCNQSDRDIFGSIFQMIDDRVGDDLVFDGLFGVLDQVLRYIPVSNTVLNETSKVVMSNEHLKYLFGNDFKPFKLKSFHRISPMNTKQWHDLAVNLFERSSLEYKKFRNFNSTNGVMFADALFGRTVITNTAKIPIVQEVKVVSELTNDGKKKMIDKESKKEEAKKDFEKSSEKPTLLETNVGVKNVASYYSIYD